MNNKKGDEGDNKIFIPCTHKETPFYEDQYIKYNSDNLNEPAGFNLFSNEELYSNLNKNNNKKENNNKNKNENNNKDINVEYITTEINNKTVITNDILGDFKYNDIFNVCNNMNHIKKSVINCYWCCMSFDSTPCVLPKKLLNNTFITSHCIFCSPECAMAYNICHNGDKSNEYSSLLHLLYSKVYKEKEILIKPAPPRECLKIFGGTMSIDEFRSSNNYFRKHQIYNEPLICETYTHSDKYDNNLNSELKLKRSKPVNKSHILNCINNYNQ